MSDEPLDAQLRSFAGIWSGGYYEGDPLTPLARSSYGHLGYMSVLHATYLRCIRPYVTPTTTALELGPGRGAWTRALLPAREVWALDALPAVETGFWEYIGRAPHVRYETVSDFSCTILPQDHFSYLFSFGCLCHVPFAGIEAYAKNLWPKLRAGAEAFWLIADYAKYNRAVEDAGRLNVLTAMVPVGRRHLLLRRAVDALVRARRPSSLTADWDEASRPGRWFHAGTERTCAMLRTVGYEVLAEDVGTSLRDPIIHFRRP